MRFAVAHKIASYLVIGFAYFAMVAGGGVSHSIALVGAIGLVGSWWWEPPAISFERWAWVWTVASILMLAYCGFAAAGSGNILGIGAQFLIWLVVVKAYNRRGARDWQQLYLLAFLMLVTGSVLNADLTYGACFLGFVISTTWALSLFHLRREIEDNLLVKHASDRTSERVEVQRILDSKRIIGKRFLGGTGLLSLVVFCASVVAFLALPRVGFGFFLKNRDKQAVTGFSDRVKLGGHGVLKSDSTVVMRVEVDSMLGGRDAPAIHWRGVAFDHYERGGWSRSYDRAPPTEDVVDMPRAGVERHTLRWRDQANDADDIQASGARQDVWLEPLDSDVMFGASTPRVFERAQSLPRGRGKVMTNDELRIDHSGTIHYTVWSQIDRPSAAALRSAHGELPPNYDVYLQYPKSEISARTLALAHDITAAYSNNFDKAVAIQNWLDENLSYTLELAEGHLRQDPLDFFLFERKRGHCEYFASAFAILARISGIPTRQVNGFLGGEWNEYQSYVAVRAGDAHSWAEVYFPGAGWVTFDPTPPNRRDPLTRGGSGWQARMSRVMDTMRFQWTKWVIEYDLVAQISLFTTVGQKLKRAALASRKAAAGVVRALPLLIAIAAAALGIFIIRRRLPAVPIRGKRAKARARSQIAHTYDHVLRQLAKSGISRPPATTPQELATTLASDLPPHSRGSAAHPGGAGVSDLPPHSRGSAAHPGGAGVSGVAPHLRELTELYYAAEWGGQCDPDAEARAIDLAKSIRSALRSSQHL